MASGNQFHRLYDVFIYVGDLMFSDIFSITAFPLEVQGLCHQLQGVSDRLTRGPPARVGVFVLVCDPREFRPQPRIVTVSGCLY